MLGRPKPGFVAMESQSEKKDAHGIEFPRVGTILSKLWGSIAVKNLEDTIIRDSIQRIGAADPANVQLIAALQMELLAGYHQIALAQSRRIFFSSYPADHVRLPDANPFKVDLTLGDVTYIRASSDRSTSIFRPSYDFSVAPQLQMRTG